MTNKHSILIVFILCAFLVNFGQKIDFFKDFYAKNGEKDSFLTNSAFKSGEKLKYKISYGKKNKKNGAILAAYATLSVTDSLTSDGTKIYSLIGSGKTTRIFSLFIKVNHVYRSLIEHKTLQTIESSMNILEGKYRDHDHTIIAENHNLQGSESNDILGAFYKLRTISQQEISQTDTLFFNYYYSNNIYNSNIINLGKEVIKTKFGKINTIKFSPLLEKGRMFKEDSQAIVWVTDNDLHIPVKIEIPILVGSIYVNIASFNGTMYNLTE